MKHEVQGQNECFPTTVAMLAGVSKDDVIEWARQAFNVPSGVSWNDFAFTSGQFWKMTPAIADHFLGVGYGHVYRSAVNLGNATKKTYEADGCAEPARRRRRSLHGRGFIQIRRYKYGHIAAFEDGVVYDPNDSGPVPYKVWRASVRGWRINAVVYIKGDAA